MGILSSGISNRMLAPILRPLENPPIKPFPPRVAFAWTYDTSPLVAAHSVKYLADGGCLAGVQGGTRSLIRLDADGNEVWVTGSLDPNNGSDTNSYSVTADSKGGLYTASRLGGSVTHIAKFDVAGNRLWAVYRKPVARSVTLFGAFPDGVFYMSDNYSSNRSSLWRLDSSGNVVWDYESESSAVYFRDAFLSSDGKRIFALVRSTSPVRNFVQIRDAMTGRVLENVELDGGTQYDKIIAYKEFIYTTRGDVVQKWTMNGDTLAEFTAIGLSSVAVCSDLAGHIYISGSSGASVNRMARRLTPDLEIVWGYHINETVRAMSVDVQTGDVYLAANRSVVKLKQL